MTGPATIPTVSVIDAHHHLWMLRPGTYDWLTVDPPPQLLTGDFRSIRQDYPAEAYLEDTSGQGVVASVHIEAGLDPLDPVAETRWVQRIADEHGFPQAIVAYAELERPDAERVIAAQVESPNVRGVRQMVSWHPDPVLSQCDRDAYLADPAWLRGFELLERYELVFDLQVYPRQMPDAAGLAMRHPSTKLVVEHTGMPAENSEEAVRDWRTGMRLLAAQPNVTVKLSGIGMVDHRWTPESMRRLYGEIVEMFGAARCMFGSNFPIDSLYGDYERLVGAFRDFAAEFDEHDRDQLCHGTASRVYGIAL